MNEKEEGIEKKVIVERVKRKQLLGMRSVTLFIGFSGLPVGAEFLSNDQ